MYVHALEYHTFAQRARTIVMHALVYTIIIKAAVECGERSLTAVIVILRVTTAQVTRRLGVIVI